jgi:hypothetical protein
MSLLGPVTCSEKGLVFSFALRTISEPVKKTEREREARQRSVRLYTIKTSSLLFLEPIIRYEI